MGIRLWCGDEDGRAAVDRVGHRTPRIRGPRGPGLRLGIGVPDGPADLDCSSLRRDHEEQPGIAAKRVKRFLQRGIDHAGGCARLRERRGQLRQALGSGSGSFRFDTTGERALAPLVGATGKQAETQPGGTVDDPCERPPARLQREK